MNSQVSETPHLPAPPPPVRWWNRLLRILTALAIIGVGMGGAAYLKNTAPKTRKRPPAKWVPLVQVESLEAGRYPVQVAAMGTVIPARQVVLKSRVTGQVIEIHPEFASGGRLRAGDLVLRLEDADYRLALTQKHSELVASRYALKLEMGRQEVARREWRLLNGNRGESETDAALALRKPHLDKVQADVAAAEAAVAKATLDLERTRVTAPFNAIVRTQAVDIGSQVTPQVALAELVGTDVYWVRASLPVDRLEWIQIPARNGAAGSRVRVHYAGRHRVEGRVIRLLGDLSDDGRMARILVEVRDPLGRKNSVPPAPPLITGEYVRVEIEGRRLEKVFTLPRTALRDNDTVWLLEPEGRLEIRTVAPVWKDARTIVVAQGLQVGEKLIVSDLPAPVEGMKLRPEGGSAGPAAGTEVPDGRQTRQSDHE